MAEARGDGHHVVHLTVLDSFRRRYRQNQADLDAFDIAASAQDFNGAHDAVAWCRAWWTDRLQGRTLDHGERQLRGAQGRN